VGPRTTILFRGTQNWRKYGLFNPAYVYDYEDRANARDGLLQVAGRHRMGRSSTLWLGLSRPEQRLRMTDASVNSSTVYVGLPRPGQEEQILPQPAWWQDMKSANLVPEARLEWTLSRSRRRPVLLSLGGSHVRIHPVLKAHIVNAEVRHFDAETRLPGHLDVAYAHYSQHVSDRLAFTAGLRYQRLETTGYFTTYTGLKPHPTYQGKGGEYLLPSLVANYEAGPRTGIRVLFARQAQEGELTPLSFAPMEAGLSSEPATRLHGTPSRTRTVEVDIERSLSLRSSVRVFGFHSFAHSVRDTRVRVTLGDVSRAGVGMRWDRQWSRHLFGSAGLVLNRTTNRTQYAPFDGQVAPYYPQILGDLALHYVDGSGTRIGLRVTHTGRFYRDTGIYSERTRPAFPAHTYLDLALVREVSPDSEYFLKASNLFNSPTIYNDYPAGERRVVGGMTLRY
jgi:hypothetical protein